MKKLIGIAQILFVFLVYASTAQTNYGSIKGTVVDAETGQGLPFASVLLMQNGVQINAVSTDIDGKFEIKQLMPGTYDIKATYIGYQIIEIKGLYIDSNKITYQKIELQASGLELEVVEIVSYKKPLVQMDQGSGLTIVNDRKSFYKSNTNSNSISNAVVFQAPLRGIPNVYPTNESYDNIEENIFKNPLVSPLSTFSVDVDRAAYANVRRFIDQDMLPPKDAIRVEEMVNYFDYNYQLPEKGKAFSINLEAGDCPWNNKSKLVRIGIQGEKLNDNEIPRSNFVFLIDVSGSMSDYNKLPLVKKSLRILVRNLRDEDKVSIVVYSSIVECVLKPTFGKNKDKIIDAIESLNASGSTAGGGGIQMAYKLAQENFAKNGNNRVILLTDGDFNVGISNDDELVKLIENERKTGVYLSILGFGMSNYKDSKMEKLSNAGNGNYGYIDNLMEAEKMFGKELWGTLYTIAKDVKIQVEFNPALVGSYRLIGYENRKLETEDFNNDTIDAGEIGAGHTVTAFYEIVLKDESADFEDSFSFQKIILNDKENLLKVRVRYKKPQEESSILVEEYLPLQSFSKEVSNDFLFASAVTEYALLGRNSPYKENASYDQLIQRAKNACEEDEFGYRHNFVEMAKKTKLLTELEVSTIGK